MIENPDLLPLAGHRVPVVSRQRGYVLRILTEVVGNAAMVLGAGRERIESEIDPAVGIMLHKKRGDRVNRGEVLAVVHSNDQTQARQARKMIQGAYIYSDRRPRSRPLIQAVVTQKGVKVIQN